MTKMILNLTECKSVLKLHDIIKETFNFPNYYGKNLDALWDCLRGYCSPDTTIYIVGFNTLPQNLYEYTEKIFKIFEDVKQEVKNLNFEIIS